MKRFLTTLAAASLVVVATSGAASAHVTVNPNTLPGGGYSELTFRAPTESDTASTVKLQVFLPAQQPLAFVGVKPIPGWTVSVTKGKPSIPVSSDDGPVAEVVQSVTWTADSPADGIPPGGFQDFDLSVGPLPTSGSMEFKALQTYSDHSVVRWIDHTVEGQAEPEHPAPLLTLTSGVSTAAPAASSSNSDTADWALGLSISALVVAAGGVGAGVVRRKA